MQKPKRKTQLFLLGTFIVLFIIFMNTTLGSIGGEKGKGVESREAAALEEALMKIEGIGEVHIYFHYDQAEGASLSNYFTSSSSAAKKENSLKGMLVVAEGVENPKVQNELKRMLSAVLQLPEHRIQIQKMKNRGQQLESE
ncbi:MULTISPECIES: hypothetical protein [Sporosarcina]|uniref:Stage III sporulation protein AG n=1 Tax=Sporosarcina contaminans TaxID=633403 RepID=A0ABW3TWM6_9BACL